LKVILTEHVAPLGPAGTIVDVAPGYARNFLIPQGKALAATAGNLTRVEQLSKRQAVQVLKEREAAQAQVARLAAVTLTIPQRVGEMERLYGSVTSAMIAEALAAQGFEIDRKQLELPEPIKKLGTYEITVRLAPEVKTQLKVEVVPEGS